MILAWACDPGLTGLFTPARPRLGRYDACAIDRALPEVVADKEDGAAFHYADPEPLEPLDAFGAGDYDRAALARLYGGRRVDVVRGWAEFPDRFESRTLLSPYPDASLTRLNPGTLMIRFTILRP